jgi:hypothetical protein
MRLDEMDDRVRALERRPINTTQDASRLLKAKIRAGQDVSWYRKCTVCKDWKSHPRIVYPIKGASEESGPIGAFKIDGFWVEFCYAEHEKYGEEELHQLGNKILHHPDPMPIRTDLPQ